jgi:carbohydrate kinase (thermoresistant glucokinase family)
VTAPLVVLIGPAGSGKTTIGRLVASELGVPFADGDDFHPQANRRRMAAGEPLDDEQRAPWLAALHTRLAAAHDQGTGLVLACSALKRSHRRQLLGELRDVSLVQLEADRETLAARLAGRRDHFFPSSLLDSQLTAFEPLTEGHVVDGRAAPGAVARAVLAALGEGDR